MNVYDLTGKLIFESMVQNNVSTKIDVNEGIYIAKVGNVTAKLVISK